ncbi:unnamed protein product [Urochloa humidicola]
MDYASWLPGAWGDRPAHVQAGVQRSDAIRAAERDLEIFALLAVQVDARARLDSRMVKHEAVRQFNVPSLEIGVSRISTATFLIRFDSQQQRNAAYRLGALRISRTALTLSPWKRQASAKAVLSKFFYRVRVCIEGIPSHLRHAEAVASLFKVPVFIDDEQCVMEKIEEEECMCFWLWTADPDSIATAGTLQVEEPVVLPEEGYAESLMELGMPMGALRSEAAKAMDYEVLIHIDRVLDYSPPLPRSRWSFDSPISGIPDEELEDEFPVVHPYDWRLGVPDASSVPEQRVSVHHRLGDRGRDRSPPRGGGAGGAGGARDLGLRQVPPSGPHDLGGPRGRAAGFYQGSSSRYSGGRYRRAELTRGHGLWKWQVKEDRRAKTNVPANEQGTRNLTGDQDATGEVRQPQRANSGQQEKAKVLLDTDLSVLDMEERALKQRRADPMIDEACLSQDGNDHPMLRQCSVEPIVAGGVQARSFLNGEKETAPLIGMQEKQWSTKGSMLAADPFTPRSRIQIDEGTAIEGPGALAQMAAENGPVRGQTQLEVGSLLDGLPFDLNQELDALQHDSAPAVATETAAAAVCSGTTAHRTTDRVILGAAEGRLNKDTKEGAPHKSAGRNITRFAVPLRKALLGNPIARGRIASAKRNAQTGSTVADKKKGTHDATKHPNLPIEEQATMLLMKATGVIGADEFPTEAAHNAFGEQFTEPPVTEPVYDIRIALGLPGEGRADVLGVLVNEAADSDD